jgi:PAS domain-containing protein
MRFDWRAICGPALTLSTTLVAMHAERHYFAVPDPSPLFVCIVAFATTFGGIYSGMISIALAVASSALFLGHRTTDGYDASVLAQLSMLATAAGIVAIVTEFMKQKSTFALACERKHHALAERLSAALDRVDIGIVLLDSDTRAEFINRAFRDYFDLPDEKADNKPPFIALMYHGRDTGAFELPADELNEFIARRTAMMRAGDSTPIHLKLADGKVLRFTCHALPDGGRVLSYTPISDLVRDTDDPARAEYYRSLRRSGNSSLTGHLHAAE